MLAEKLIYTTVFCLATLSVAAQDSTLHHDYQFVKQADPWLTSQNGAALTRYASGSMAQAELSLSGGRGGLTNYWESPRWLTVNTSIESYYRYSPRTVFFGSMSYENFSGREMAGSAFINPDRQPFDIVEDSITNTGTKHRDTYRLSGGFGTEVITGLSLGMTMDFTAANYARYKDLRHMNKLMDLQLTAGIYAPTAPATISTSRSSPMPTSQDIWSSSAPRAIPIIATRCRW